MLLGTFMLTATVAQAGNVLYAEAEGETMILKCADSAPEGLKVYDGTTNWQIMGVTTVIVDASCQSYTGNTLDYLFNTASNKLKTITGLNNLNTASVTSMGAMFLGCSGLTSIDISSFNTANVTVMSYMFFGCSALTSLDLRSFNTSHVTDMTSMFAECSNLTSIDLSGWNTTNVISMYGMFNDCSSLTSLDLSGWNTTNVMRMSNMFWYCKSLTTLDLSGWNTANVTEMYGMFNQCEALTTIYADNWDTSKVPSNNSVFSDCPKLVGGAGTAWQLWRNGKSYARIDRGEEAPGFFTAKGQSAPDPVKVKEAYAVLSDDNTTLTFYYDENKETNGGMDVGPFTFENGVDSGWYEQRENITTVVFDDSFAECTSISSTALWFYECTNLTTISGIEKLNTANVTDMSCMFASCSSLTNLNISNFNTEKVKYMAGMFEYCYGLTSLDVSNFNTTNVTNMSGMFYYCYGMTNLDVSNFNTANVTSMRLMFSGCSGLTSLDVNNFNTANVKDMGGMFDGCSGLTSLDLSNFNTTNVTMVSAMFYSCSGLTSLDLSNFNTEKVEYMAYMFELCSSLTTIYSNDEWNCYSSKDMFKGCTSLKGAISYDSGKTDATYANPTTGYFTAVDKGDANGDGEISDKDVETVENHIMGNKPTNYVFAGADSNGDGVINVADIVDIINKK